MIVDTSALVAVLMDEVERPAVEALLHTAERAKVSAGSLLEAGSVIDSRLAPGLGRRLDDLIQAFDIETVAVDLTQVTIARAAYREFGRGSGHPARLNFGDCFAYALARATGEALLFVGGDFTHTDVRAALPN